MENSHIPTPEERREERMERSGNMGSKTVRTIYALIMIVVYIGMGVLLLINFFGWNTDWAWTRYVVGIVLIIYGIWRAYRKFSGIDSQY